MNYLLKYKKETIIKVNFEDCGEREDFLYKVTSEDGLPSNFYELFNKAFQEFITYDEENCENEMLKEFMEFGYCVDNAVNYACYVNGWDFESYDVYVEHEFYNWK